MYKECRSTEREDRVLQICFADNDSCILDLTSDNTCIKTVYSDDQDSSNSEVKETCGKAKCIIEDKKQQSLTLADLYKQLININLSVQDTRNILVRHVEETLNRYGQIQDKIVSLKKHSSLMSSSNNPKIAELSDKTALVQEEISHLSNSVYTRLNSIYDTRRRIPCNQQQNRVEPHPKCRAIKHPLNTKLLNL